MFQAAAAPVAWGRQAFDQARWEAKALLGKRDDSNPWSVFAVLNGVFWPTMLFLYVYASTFGARRFYSAGSAIIMGPVVGLALCVLATAASVTFFKRNWAMRTLGTVAVCLWVALVAGLLASDRTYWQYMSSYFTYQDLAVYTNIDPAADKGQSYMDAGQVYFRENADVDEVDLSAFRAGSLYCVAPILGAPIWNQGGKASVMREGALQLPESGTVDFWAVGTDCCDPVSKTFTCGQVANGRARAGLRLLRDDQRPYYMLAVQAWTAKTCAQNDNTASGESKAAPKICVPARHPLFFHWVEDPVSQVDTFLLKGEGQFQTDVILFMAVNFALVMGLLHVLQKIGVH